MYRKISLSKKNLIQWLLIILLYESHDSALFIMFQWPLIIISLLVSIYCFIHYVCTRSKKVFFFVLFVLADILFVRFLNNGGIGVELFLRWSSMFLIAWIAYSIIPEQFIDKFVKFTTVMAGISIIFFALTMLDVNMVRSLSVLSYTPWEGAVNYGGILYTVTQGYERNSGVFNEPGLYQILLNTALFLSLFYKNQIYIKEKYKSWIVFILIVTLITTQSTTAYLGMISVIIGYILTNTKDKLRRRLVGLLLCATIFLAADYIINGNDSLFNKVVVEKISDINHDTSTDYIVSSGQARLLTIQMSLRSAIREPFGIGIDRYNLELRASTKYAEAAVGAVLFSSLVTMGLFAVLFIVGFFIYGAWKNRISNISFIIILILFFNTLSAQSDLFYPGIWILMFIKEKSYIAKSEEIYENTLAMQSTNQTSIGITRN